MTPLTDAEVDFIESEAAHSPERMFLLTLIEEVRLERGLLRMVTGSQAVVDYLAQCEGDGTRGWIGE